MALLTASSGIFSSSLSHPTSSCNAPFTSGFFHYPAYHLILASLLFPTNLAQTLKHLKEQKTQTCGERHIKHTVTRQHRPCIPGDALALPHLEMSKLKHRGMMSCPRSHTVGSSLGDSYSSTHALPTVLQFLWLVRFLALGWNKLAAAFFFF